MSDARGGFARGPLSGAARLFGGAPPRVTRAEGAEVVAQLHRAAARAVGPVAEVTGMQAPAPRPGTVHVVDRTGWAVATARMLQGMAGPHLARHLAGRGPGTAAGAARPASRARAVALSAQIGAVLGLLSSRVLGQYDHGWGTAPPPADAPGAPGGHLLLVAPNLVAAERAMGADPAAFRLWVCLHEETHRVQFEAHPWLAGHLRAVVADTLDLLFEGDPREVDALVHEVTSPGHGRGARPRGARAARDGTSRAVPDGAGTARTGGAGAGLDRLVALMTLLEGHADVVMDAVGPRVVPGVARLRRQLAARRAGGSPVELVLRRMLGLDAKMRQYAEGAAFVRAVQAAAGTAGTALAFSGPQNLPTTAELGDPARWLVRVGATA